MLLPMFVLTINPKEGIMSERIKYTMTFTLPWQPGPGWPGCETIEQAIIQEQESFDDGGYDPVELLGVADNIEWRIEKEA